MPVPNILGVSSARVSSTVLFQWWHIFFASILKMHVNLIVSTGHEVYTGLFTNFESCTLRLFCQLFLRIVLWRTCELFFFNNLSADPIDLFQSLRALLLDILLTFSTDFLDLRFLTILPAISINLFRRFLAAFLDIFVCTFHRFVLWIDYSTLIKKKIKFFSYCI